MPAKFRPSEVLRLEVQTDDAGLANLVQNPSGALGGWGWVTPVPGSALTGPHIESTLTDFDADTFMLLTPPGAAATWVYTELLPITAGRYAAARWEAGQPSTARHRAVFEWLDSARAVLGASLATNELDTGSHSLGPHQAPAGTVYGRLRFDVTKPGGAVPDATDVLELAGVTVAAADASDDLGSGRANLFTDPSFEDDPPLWTSTLGTAAEVTTDTAVHGSASLSVRTTATRTRVNLVTNPSFETTIGGWQYGGPNDDPANPTPGTLTRVSGLVTGFAGGWTARLRTNVVLSSLRAFNTDAVPVVAGTRYGYAVRFRRPASEGRCRARISIQWERNNGATVSGKGFGTVVEAVASEWRTSVGYGVAPAGATKMRLIVIGYDLPPLDRLAFDAAQVEALDETEDLGPYFDGDTPSDELTTYAWDGTPGNSSSRAVTKQAVANVETISQATTVNPGADYTVSLSAWGTQARPTSMVIYDGDTALPLSTRLNLTGYGTAPARFFDTMTVPAGTTKLLIQLRWDRIEPNEVHYIDAVMIEQANELRPFIVGTTSDADLSFIEPISYVNVLGPTHQINTDRAALDVGTLTAVLYSAALDPAKYDVIRPGRRMRLRTRMPELGYGEADFGEGPYGGRASGWSPLFTGRITKAAVTYDPLQRDPDRRARIEVTAVDPTAPLANVSRDEGVATIGELPYVLEGAGIPWNVNGSGGQVPDAVVVSRNDQASAIDQVAVTRDTALGYAWVDREGVLQAWDADVLAASSLLSAGGVKRLDEGDYRGQDGIDLSYDTDQVVNEVSVNFLRLNPATGESEEVLYGPWRDEASVQQWGVHSATYTVHGLSEETSALEAYAEAVLAANAHPRVRASSAVIPIHEPRQTPKALLDLYDAVTVVAADFEDDLRVTSVSHEIVAGPRRSKWLMTLGFSDPTQVAPAQAVPSPSSGSGALTVGQLLRPLGEVTMWYGQAADLPPGWLVLDGSTYSAETYPRLFEHLGTTVLPNLVDRLPIGAGSKALGTIGGSATKTLTVDQLPPHTHGVQSREGGPGPQTTVYAQGAGTGTITTSPTGSAGGGEAFDALPPWLALYFIIRAV